MSSSRTHVWIAVGEDVLRHGHIYSQKAEALRRAGFGADVIAFVPETRYDELADSYKMVKERTGCIVETVPKHQPVAEVMRRLFSSQLRRRETTIVHCVKVDPAPLYSLRREAAARGAAFNVILELEGDFASERHYLYEVARRSRPRMWPDHTFRQTYETHVSRDIERIRHADLLVLMSAAHLTLWHQRYRMPPVLILPPWPDPSFAFDPVSRASCRREWGVGDELVVVYAGGIRYPWQRFADIVAFAARFRSVVSSVVLKAFVPLEDVAPAREALRYHSVPGTVDSIPASQVPGALSGADVAVFPRHLHPMNLIVPSAKLGEYLAAGLPVLSTSAHALYWPFIREVTEGFCLPDDMDLSWEQLLKCAVLARKGQDPAWRSAVAARFLERYCEDNDSTGAYISAVAQLQHGERPRSPTLTTAASAGSTAYTSAEPRIALFVLCGMEPADIRWLSRLAVRARQAAVDLVVTWHDGSHASWREAAVNTDLKTDFRAVGGRDPLEAALRAAGLVNAEHVVFVEPQWEVIWPELHRLQGHLSSDNAPSAILAPMSVADRHLGLEWRTPVPNPLTLPYELRHSTALSDALVVVRLPELRRLAGIGTSLAAGFLWGASLEMARTGTVFDTWDAPLAERHGRRLPSAEQVQATYQDGLAIIRAAHGVVPWLSGCPDVLGPCPCRVDEALRRWSAWCAGAITVAAEAECTAQYLQRCSCHPSIFDGSLVDEFVHGALWASGLPPSAAAELWRQYGTKLSRFLEQCVGESSSGGTPTALRQLLDLDCHAAATRTPQPPASPLELADQYGVRALARATWIRLRRRLGAFATLSNGDTRGEELRHSLASLPHDSRARSNQSR